MAERVRGGHILRSAPATWGEIEPTFRWLASTFSGSESFDYEVLAPGVSGDLGYVAGIEHTVAARHGAEPVSYRLRVTTVFRREDGAWKVVHRHGDPFDASSVDALAGRDRATLVPPDAPAET